MTTEAHIRGCACPACATGLEEPQAPTPEASVAHAPKPGYDNAQVVEALTTEGGTDISIAWAGWTVSYSVGTGAVGPASPDYSSEFAGYVAMTATMEAFARTAFALWDEVIAIDLVERHDDPGAGIVFNYSSNTGGGTYARTSFWRTDNAPRAQATIADSDIWLAHDWWTHDQDRDLVQGSYAILTYLHEIGHALGLTHPGAYNGSASFAADAGYLQDTRQYTVMSYFDAGENGSGTDHVGSGGRSYGSTPLLHDILAAQAVYGADMTTRTGDTVYGFNATAGRAAFDFTLNRDPVVAIWDAGGIDRLDLSGFAEDQVIRLGGGQFSSTGRLTNNIAIAYGALIEQAVGGAGDDTIYGNAAGNAIWGGAGADRIDGGRGDDTLHGGPGADLILGSDGRDLLSYEQAAAAVAVDLRAQRGTAGEAAGDRIASVEDLAGSDHADTLAGSDDANRMTGGAGDDRIYGRAGDDSIEGGAGHDFLLGDEGDDLIAGGDGSDVLRGGPGADWLDGGDGFDFAGYRDAPAGVAVDLAAGSGSAGWADGDRLVAVEGLLGSAHADTLSGDGGANLLRGGGGDDRIAGRGGNDVLDGGAGADVFVFAFGDGIDRLHGFALAEDRLDLSATGLGFADLALGAFRGDASVAYAPGDVIVLTGIDWTALTEDQFILA